VQRFGRLNFVDLAGSERLKETHSQGDMLKETGSINKSLFTLGQVIKELSEQRRRRHVPYRDAKLTMLLMDTLGGNARALMIACVTPATTFFEETFSTMSYAARTMNIRNTPII